MKKFWTRLVYESEGKPFSPFVWVYTFKTLAVGLLFTFFSGTNDIQELTLFHLTNQYLPNFIANAWGVLMIVVVALHVVALQTRNYAVGKWVGILGASAWMYAFAIYALKGMVFSVIVIPIGPFVYYVWFMKLVKNYELSPTEGFETVGEPVDESDEPMLP